MIRLFYSALWWAGLPFVLLRLWRRGSKEPGYRRHITDLHSDGNRSVAEHAASMCTPPCPGTACQRAPVGALLREAAAGIDCVAAQSERDAERLRLAGARRVHVTGNIKFDVAAPADMVALGKQWRAQSGARPVLLCASTRAGEEELILQALRRIERSNFLTVIVPRHPQRFDEVAAMIAAHGFIMQRRSHGMQAGMFEVPLQKVGEVV